MTLAIAEAQAQVSPDGRSVSVFDAISSRQHGTQKMQSAVRVPFGVLCFLVAGILGQDVKPEIPEYLPPPTTEAPATTLRTTTTMEVPTTVPSEETTIIPTQPPTTLATEPTTSVAETTKTTTEQTTTSTAEPITISTTESTSSSTTESTTISTTESTTSSTTTTQMEPLYPPSKPPSLPPNWRPTSTRRPIYTTKNPWNWNEPAERCYLKEQHQYISTCWGYGWTTAFNCYRCCYYPNSDFAGCSKLHRGRCGWFD